MNNKLKTKRQYLIYLLSGVFVLPFLGGGVFVAGLLAMWLTGTKLHGQSNIWFLLLLLGLMPLFVIACGLIANVIWMLLLSRFASLEEMKWWSIFDTTYLPLWTPASRAIDDFFIKKKSRETPPHFP